MKTLLTALSVLTLGTTTGLFSLTAISSNVMQESNVKELSFSKIDFNDLITETNLGNIVFDGNTPTKTELLDGIKSKNSYACGLTVNDFKYKQGTLARKDNAIIIGQGKFQGEITLTYSKQSQ